MKKITYTFIAAIICQALISQVKNGQNYEGTYYSSALLREDLLFVKKVLEEAHPNLYRFTSKPSLDSAFTAAEKKLTVKMSELEFYKLVASLFELIKCGHTRVSPPASAIQYIAEKGNIFPFDVKIINKRLYVYRNFSTDLSIQPGSEIKSINGVPISKLINMMFPATFADGHILTMRYKLIEKEFFFFYFLLIGSSSEFKLDIIDPVTNKEFTRQIKSGTIQERKNPRKPLLDLSVLSDRSSAILTVASFDQRRYERSNINYFRFIDSVFTIINASKIKKLIIDIRGNDGGNPSYVSHLYKQFAQQPYNLLNTVRFKTPDRLEYFGDNVDTADFYRFKLNSSGDFEWADIGNDWYGQNYQPSVNNFKDEVCVVMDGGSFSSSGFFGTIFKYYKRGKVFGEESGGGCTCNDCHGTVKLPNTGLSADVARCAVTMNLAGLRCNGHGIIPDHIIEQSVEDLIKEKDTVLEYVLNYKP